MITGKKRAVALLLSLLLFAALLTGCGISEDDQAALELLRALKDQAAQQAQAAPEQYLVILPANSTSELSLIARELSGEIEKKTGIECDYEYDSVEISNDKDRVDILLGNTNRRISAETLNKFKNDDYICKFVDGALVIGGVSDAATVVAVERFMSEILPSATAQALMADDAGFEYHGEYMLKDVLLCGYDARDYVIVFSDADAQQMCVSFRGLIAKQSGIYLELKAGNAYVNGQKEIFLDIDETALTACAKRVGEDIYLIGRDTYSLSVAVSSFYNMLLASEKDGTVRLDISDQLAYSYSNTVLNVMSTVSDISIEESSVYNISSLANTISNSKSDIVVLAGMGKDVWEAVTPGVSNSYGRLEGELSDGTFVPVLYLKETLNIVESGSAFIDNSEVLKLVLEHNASSERYVLYCFSSNNVSFQSVNQALKNTDGLAMATVMTPEKKDNSVVPDDGVSIIYNGVLSASGVEYRHLWMIEYPQLAYDGVQRTTLNRSDYISFDVGNRYCAEYRELMS